MKRSTRGGVLSTVILTVVVAVAGCAAQSSPEDDRGARKPSSSSSSSSPAPKQGIQDAFLGLKFDLSTGPWLPTVNQPTAAQIVYEDRSESPDCVQQTCPLLLIQTNADPTYQGRVANGKMIKDNGCAEGASAFESPKLKGTVKIAGMTADYYESAPCGAEVRTRRDWVIPDKYLFTEISGGDGRLAKKAFDKALEGAVKWD